MIVVWSPGIAITSSEFAARCQIGRGSQVLYRGPVVMKKCRCSSKRDGAKVWNALSPIAYISRGKRYSAACTRLSAVGEMFFIVPP